MLYKIIFTIANVLFRILYRIEVINKENILDNKKLIICGNHTHNFDVIMVSILFPNQIHWMGKKELFDFKPLGFILDRLGAFPVDREKPGLSVIRNSMKILKEDKTLGIFPEGTRVKGFDIKNAKPGVALISISTESPILPLYIEGTYRPFSKIKVTIGEAYEFDEAYGTKPSSEEYKAYGEEVLYSIYDLKENNI